MKTVRIHLGARSYSIQIGKSALRLLGPLARQRFPGGRALVLSDSRVGPLYAERARDSLNRAGLDAAVFNVPAGERSKSLAQLSRLYDRLAALGFDRGCGLIALGGGVVGDLGGLAAATYLRGLPYLQAPTSLLAQVDSAVGGKTGINHPLGKNLIGAFYQPVAVVSDLGVLKSLSPREFRAGLAEAVKHGAIADARFFGFMEKNAGRILRMQTPALETLVAACCRIKGRVVEADEREADRRQILNFGHTLGHALEALAGYSRKLLHGEAVSIGMAAAARLSLAGGLCREQDVKRLLGLLERFGLPVSLKRHPPMNAVRRAVMRDKKTRKRTPRFVLLQRIGKVATGCEVPPRRWRRAVEGR